MNTNSFFPDTDLIAWATKHYGPEMGVKCDHVFKLDPERRNLLANSLRRSLTREIAADLGGYA